MSAPITIAVTIGDPRGIGTEVMPQAAERFLEQDPRIGLVVLGAVRPTALVHPGIEWRSVGSFDGSAESAGEVSLAAIHEGVRMCLSGDAQALVTGPVHKGALRLAGSSAPGQTEILAEITESPLVGMLMASESSLLGSPIRVLLATTHLPLRSVPDAVTTNLLVDQTRLLRDALRGGWQIRDPRLALCALNPHASDGGLFGDEEARVFTPAVSRLRSEGVNASDPIPADTVFRRAGSGEFDAVVAPYHDVGMAGFKTLAFGSGVNTTIGLPFPRTSPDHGTAFDIAGTGEADPGSALEALRLAGRLARTRGEW